MVAEPHDKEALAGEIMRDPGKETELGQVPGITLLPLDVTKQALSTFHGVARRFTVIGVVGGVTLVDDYGHHPAEVKATIEAAQRAFPGEGHRIVLTRPPHCARSRT